MQLEELTPREKEIIVEALNVIFENGQACGFAVACGLDSQEYTELEVRTALNRGELVMTGRSG